MSILQGRARRYGKACDHKVSGSGGSGWERSCLSIHCCMDHVSEVCQRASPLLGRKKTGSRRSAGPPLPTGSSTVRRTISSRCNYFHRELLKRSFAMADETRVQVLKEEGRQAQTQSFICSEAARMDFRRLSCMAIPLPGAAAMQRVSGRLQRIPGNGWISGIQQSSGDQTLLLLGAYPSILYRRRSQRKTV